MVPAESSGQPAQPPRLRGFQALMQNRVHRILLISSLYDSFIMSEEGHLHETLLSQYLDLNMTQFPDLVRVPSGSEALALLEREQDFDLVISSLYTGDWQAAELAHRIRAAGLDVPVVGLAYTSRELTEFCERYDTSEIERIFLWQGDVRILLAIIKSHEDRLNVEHDTGSAGVPVILVVEDNIRFYSSFLPAIYSELFSHTHRLLSEDLSLSQRMLRMRARPKVLLSHTFEQAWNDFEAWESNVLGVISDFEFPHEGRLDPRAGLDLCSRVAQRRADIRLVLQSSVPENEALAAELGASFLLKGSPVLLNQLRDVLINRFGFGPFVFRRPDGSVVDRASDLKSLEEKLRTVPAESIAYHAERNHFSNWLKARTEFALAEKLRPQKVGDFESVEHLRAHVLQQVRQSRRDRHRSIIADFDRQTFEPEVSITRIGGGSLGGKARGVAFANRVLRTSGIAERFPDVDVYVPPCVVLGTQIFDEFMDFEFIRDFALQPNPEQQIREHFLKAPLPRRAASALRAFLQRVDYPLAVRSSSLLEDSLAQPFAGVYRTFMIPNRDPSTDTRLAQLSAAVKSVYASAFSQQAKTYLSLTAFRLEEERMAVMIQQTVGVDHRTRFYPDFAGVARSYNYYPEPGHSAEDGVVAVALGFGRTVVDGSPCLRFCPRYPQQIVTLSSVSDALRNSQREFWALNVDEDQEGVVGLERHPLEHAEEDGVLTWLGSTYSADDDRIVDGISRAGVRLVSFAQILKHGAFPLAELVSALLEACSQGTGAPVEIEFAGNLPRRGRKAQLAFLQLRPLAMSKELENVDLDDVPPERVVCKSSSVLGNGRIADVRDIVFVDPRTFDRQRTREVAQEVARFDARLRGEGRPYLLVGLGRWGSADPSLGIPVAWSQIAGARVIVEAGFEDIHVAPSQGTHFFQNLTSSQVGYFTINPERGEGRVDWEWLARLEDLERAEFVRLARLKQPLEIRMNGRRGQGLIARP